MEHRITQDPVVKCPVCKDVEMFRIIGTVTVNVQCSGFVGSIGS